MKKIFLIVAILLTGAIIYFWFSSSKSNQSTSWFQAIQKLGNKPSDSFSSYINGNESDKSNNNASSSPRTQPHFFEKTPFLFRKQGDKSGSLYVTSSTQSSRISVIEKTPPIALKQDIGAKLDVCNLGEDCSGDMGSTHWMKEATINVKSMRRGFWWRTDQKDVSQGLLEISSMPMGNHWPSPVLYTQHVSRGTFIVDFSSLLQSQEHTSTSTSSKQNTNKGFFTLSKPLVSKNTGVVKAWSAIQPKTYYIHVLPVKDGKIAGKPTNEVVVKMVPPSEDVKLYSAPDIYTVKIKDFQPIKGPDPNVCPHAMILDTDYVFHGQVIGKAGERICPPSYKGEGEKPWYESLWDALKSGVDWVSETYTKLKSAIVSVVGDVVCAGNETCMKGLAAGLDIGLVAMGIPPDLPNFDQLIDQGFDYVVSEISTQVGCSDVVCKTLIEQNLRTVLDQHKNQSVGQACDTEAAHAMGIEPVCFPPGVTAHWDPVAMHQDAKVVLSISRNNQDIPKDFTPHYTLTLKSWAVNSKAVGQWIINIQPYNKKLEIKQPLEGKIFEDVTLPIPDMQKGETIDIPINLVATDYWVPGHKELMEGWTTVVYHDGWPSYEYDDWWLFYRGARISLSAAITGIGSVQTTVSSDTKEVQIP